jgi:uncharacterized membrane protein YsdA (DUF1294 family)
MMHGPDTLAWILGLACWLVAANGLAILAFHHDKRMAQTGGRRIPERTLLALALAGGSPGALTARARFRHKTRKQPFGALLHGICAVQAALILWVAVAGPRGPLDALTGIVSSPPAFTHR